MSRVRSPLPFALCLLSFAFLCACGYHVATSGMSETLPTNIKTIAVPAFNNVTVSYKLTSYLPQAITREFITRTRYRVVNDPNDADAVLTGSVIRVDSLVLTIDPKTGRAASIQSVVTMQLKLVDRATNAVLFERPRFDFRQTYEIAVNPNAYFDEGDMAMNRLSREVARSVVSAILESF